MDLLDFKHHKRWLKTRPGILMASQPDWGEFPRGHLHVFSVDGWAGKCNNAPDGQSHKGLRRCRFCNLAIKTDNTPDGFYGSFPPESTICGHALEAGLDGHTGGDEENFPILGNDWRIKGDIDQEAQKFLEVADSIASVEAVQNVAKAGNKLAGNYADIILAERQVQEIHVGSIAWLARNARELLVDEPVLGEEISRLHELGTLPYYGGQSHGATRASGLPYDEPETLLIVSMLWEDVREGRVLAVRADSIKADTPMIPAPTTTVLKKLPDRTISTDVRIISDLILANMFCAKADYPEIHLADIGEIAARAVTPKRTWPNVGVVWCKSDIDDAFKIMRTHPDMCVLLCAEFSGRFSEIAGNKSLLYLTLPFDWRGSPSYFPCAGRGVTLTHKSFPPANKLRDGPQDM